MNTGTKIILWVLRITLPCLVIGAAVVLYLYIMKTAPEHKRKRPEERKVFVEAAQVHLQNTVVHVHATGTVIPVERVALKARVSGEVLELNPQFEPGEIIKKGEVIVKIDQADYLLDEKLAESKLVQAEYEYKLELGHQEVARHEWEILDNPENATELEKELTLRKPHLKRAKAGVESAKTNLERARLNLQRTSVSLPFDALVLSRNVSVGSQVTAQSELGVFVDASRFRIEAIIPFDQLGWIKLPSGGEAGASAEIRPSGGSNESVCWQGTVTGLVPEIESRGRMAQLLIDVENPLEGDVPLLLNSYVLASIASRELKNVFVIPSRAVHNGDLVYVVNKESRVVFKKIGTIWRDKEWVVTESGVEDGDMVIISEVPSAVPDMRVEVIKKDDPRLRPASGTASQQAGGQQSTESGTK